MKIADLIDRELKWSQPKAFKMNYELRAGKEKVATLRFRSSFGSFATGESAEGCWTFKRVGFFSTRATIRPCKMETEIATFKNNTWKGGGTLILPDGRTYPASTNLWMTRFELMTSSEEPLIEFKNGGMVHLSAMVNIKPAAARLSELPWMVMFGWYLIVMMQCDSSGAGAAAAAG